MKYYFITILICSIFVNHCGYCSVEESLSRREEQFLLRTFKWKFVIENTFLAPIKEEVRKLPLEARTQVEKIIEKGKHKTVAILSITKKENFEILSFEVIDSTNIPKDTYKVIFSKDYAAILYPTQFVDTQHDINRIHTVQVIPTPVRALYMGAPAFLSGIGSDIYAFQPAFHALANPMNVVSPFGWLGYDIHQIKWHITKDNKYFVYLETKSSELEGYLKLSKSHGFAPAQMVFEGLGEKKYEWKTTGWTSVDGVWLPRKVVHIYSSKSMRTEAVAHLVDCQKVNSEYSEQLIKTGTDVIDYRLRDQVLDTPRQTNEGIVSYKYTGRFPTKDELRELAYQQGSLLPPETPQRRYSFWMFLPATALFGLALLFYLKRRR